MDQLKSKIDAMLKLMGFEDFSIAEDTENRKISIFVNASPVMDDKLGAFVGYVDYIARLIARKENFEPIFIDINNYRKDRENIILDLAKAAARRALITKTAIDLPAMNAYERRLIHVELSMRPDVKTESIGEGKLRHVIVRPI
ncbi:MAG: hypothetical protein A3A04_01040 [Candidatus Harrisonbacteria bacterium RIFCSPLOWO2_01_FULL_40_28]|uniref:R3H domain-containing protein n=2 Tax=Candidatus Harrisoniibacteriota TaxID=1817905 RepID=A0A1G1ZYS9_9BACT|nr:MAG: hypothetical protein A3A04_01040 [Candidatus Harrisonbacteria bacterium RIFCSPLOWO2_01_FULL_40_28]OGY69659.1 MAG: hypothetical protein A2586_01505 [Candidatus Harrisonbacteria bacterium RIFOXYD1_FULL_40_9]